MTQTDLFRRSGMCTQGGAAGKPVCGPSGDTDAEENDFQESEPLAV